MLHSFSSESGSSEWTDGGRCGVLFYNIVNNLRLNLNLINFDCHGRLLNVSEPLSPRIYQNRYSFELQLLVILNLSFLEIEILKTLQIVRF